MLSIHVKYAEDLPITVTMQCLLLCHEGSEMQDKFRRIAADEFTGEDHRDRIAYATKRSFDEHGGLDVVVGWASLTKWQIADQWYPQLQAFVAPAHRNFGVCTALCVCLTHGLSTNELPTAVFSEECGAIARRLGWRCKQYRSTDDGWIATASFGFSEGGECGVGDDAAGVHAPPSTVRDLSLASDEEGTQP